MNTSNYKIIRYTDLPQGGFAGIVEKQMVVSEKLSPNVLYNKNISHGFSDFIYLSKGHFKANDGAPLHPHNNVDIVTLVLSGSISHTGTLGDGTIVYSSQVQVQRSGTGMKHSEVNSEDTPAEFVQIWFLPPKQNLKPAYQNIDIKKVGLTEVLGSGIDCFENVMTCKIGNVLRNEVIQTKEETVILITKGEALIDSIKLGVGDLIQGTDLYVTACSNIEIVLINETKNTKQKKDIS